MTSGSGPSSKVSADLAARGGRRRQPRQVRTEQAAARPQAGLRHRGVVGERRARGARATAAAPRRSASRRRAGGERSRARRRKAGGRHRARSSPQRASSGASSAARSSLPRAVRGSAGTSDQAARHLVRRQVGAAVGEDLLGGEAGAAGDDRAQHRLAAGERYADDRHLLDPGEARQITSSTSRGSTFFPLTLIRSSTRAEEPQLAAVPGGEVAGGEAAAAEARIRLRQIARRYRRRLHRARRRGRPRRRPPRAAPAPRRTPSTGVPTVPRSPAPPSRS